ncbi:hypothetical protein Nepgr_006183 [Nepenthes gracilis]|uniref:Uncharacterized protein n=1 Tax=Nepenthes gracilis TaxID=150966 RepID=A0AAD3S4X9_NEPGR|nr:hypothetical protein Nepgr_006183 [Nepenthes gracilis]
MDTLKGPFYSINVLHGASLKSKTGLDDAGSRLGLLCNISSFCMRLKPSCVEGWLCVLCAYDDRFLRWTRPTVSAELQFQMGIFARRVEFSKQSPWQETQDERSRVRWLVSPRQSLRLILPP